jgi:hypothetical protein
MPISPIDYSINVPDPSQSVQQGFQFGAQVRDTQIKQQQQDLALQQQQQAMQQQRQQQQVIQSLISNPNPTAQDYSRATLAVPGMEKQLKQSWDMHSAEQQRSALDEISKVHAALASGNPDIAIGILKSRSEALKNSNGDSQQIQAADNMAEVIKAHPDFARAMVGMRLASIPGGEKVIEGVSKLGAESRAVAEAPLDIAKKTGDAAKAVAEGAGAPAKVATDLANVKSQIDERTKRLALDRDKFTSELQLKLAEFEQKTGELPEYVAKEVNGAITSSVAAKQSAEKMNSLANQIEQARLSSGASASVGELWKKTFGTQNELTRIRSEYSRIVTPAAMAAYKKVATGSTSDKDIDTAMVGVPKDTANPEIMAAFLRGAAKLQNYESILQNAQAEWQSANKSLSKSKRDMEIDGVKVPAGSSFKDFSEQYLVQKTGVNNGRSLVDSLAAKYGAQPETQAQPGMASQIPQ